MLSGLEMGEFVQAVNEDNKKLLATIPGVSQRGAGFIVEGLRGKLDDYSGGMVTVEAVNIDVSADAESALVGLGYKSKEASKALAQIESPAEDVETLIRQALKELMKG